MFKKIIFSIIAVAICLIAAEAATRLIFFAATGNRFYLIFGRQPLGFAKRYEDFLEPFSNYYKFKPNLVYEELDWAEKPLHINSHGFRGPDFSKEKEAEVLRIACLGASSTFGFHVNDEEAYPYILQETLKRDRPVSKIEVINCGIPWFESSHILNLVKKEVLDYEPDIITIYLGHNDSVASAKIKKRLHKMNIYEKVYYLKEGISSKSLFIYKLKNALGRFREKIGAPTMKSLLPKYVYHVVTPVDERVVVDDAIERADMVERNLKELIRFIRQNSPGTKIILIKQPMTLYYTYQAWNDYAEDFSNDDLKKRPYYKQYMYIKGKLDTNGEIYDMEMPVITHYMIMDRLDDISESHGVDIVDFIEVADKNLDYLQSYVHLSRKGNKALAELLSDKIEKIIKEVE